MRVVWTATALMLAGCGTGETTQETAGRTGEVSLTNASVEEVGRQISAARQVRFQPGEWETRVEVLDIQLAGVPEGAAARLGQALKAQAQSATRHCLTAEDANKPQAEMLTGGVNNRCRFRRFSMSDGRMQGKLVCAGGPGGGEMTIETDGRFTATSFAMQSALQTGSGGAAPAMTMKMQVNGRRLGACNA